MSRRGWTAFGITVALVLAVGCGPLVSGARCSGEACVAGNLCLGESQGQRERVCTPVARCTFIEGGDWTCPVDGGSCVGANVIYPPCLGRCPAVPVTMICQ